MVLDCADDEMRILSQDLKKIGNMKRIDSESIA